MSLYVKVFKIGPMQYLCVSSPESEKVTFLLFAHRSLSIMCHKKKYLCVWKQGSLFSRVVFAKFSNEKDGNSFEAASRGEIFFLLCAWWCILV